MTTDETTGMKLTDVMTHLLVRKQFPSILNYCSSEYHMKSSRGNIFYVDHRGGQQQLSSIFSSNNWRISLEIFFISQDKYMIFVCNNTMEWNNYSKCFYILSTRVKSRLYTKSKNLRICEGKIIICENSVCKIPTN